MRGEGDADDMGAAIRHANARIAALREKVTRDVAALGLDLPLICHGIKQVSIDPDGFLLMKHRTGEDERMATAQLYASIHEGFEAAVSELTDIAGELFTDECYRAFLQSEVDTLQTSHPDISRWLLEAASTYSYVCGTFAWEYPEHLLRMFPSTARTYHDLLAEKNPGEDKTLIAMQMAMIDFLMCPNEAGWQDLVQRN
jgi:hypothetical protein